MKANASRIGRLNTISAGEKLQCGSQILRSCIIALRKRSVSKIPVESIFDQRSRFVDFTATSARPTQDGGKHPIAIKSP